MDANRRTSTLRRVATTASLAALILLPAGQAEAKKSKAKPKSPVITKVTPMDAKIGDKLTIQGKHFRVGQHKNSVGFKSDGSAVVFVRSDLSTERMMTVRLPAKLEKVMFGRTTKFHLRVLAKRFGKSFTSDKLAPTITPRPPVVPPTENPDGGEVVETPPVPSGPANDCDDDGALNATDADDDNDLLPDARENEIGTDGCKADTDSDGVTDGYEYRSGIDLNDDEYQQPNTTLPYPKDLPYPNPLFPDADKDHDGDGLPMAAEYDLWIKLTNGARSLDDVPGQATPLIYSAGLKYSVSRRCGAEETGGLCGQGNIHQNRRVPTLGGNEYDKWQAFKSWAEGSGYLNIYLRNQERWLKGPAGWNEYSILDIDRNHDVDPKTEAVSLDAYADGFLSDDERDEDADGLSNFDELRGRATAQYWTACYTVEPVYEVEYEGTDPANPDTDGDGVRDGADDQDHDDVPNMMELSRNRASHLDDTDDGIKESVTGGLRYGRECKPDPDLKAETPWHPDAYGQVNPFNPCMPDNQSRTCQLHPLIGATLPPDWWSLN
jgi:hypothetical protein